MGAVVVADGRLLMVQRGKEPGAGLWSLPGGRVEHGEYLAEALRREVAEETGLAIEVRDLVGILEVLGDPHYVILDYFAEVAGDGDPVAGDDVSDARWVPLDEVTQLQCTPRFVETLRGWGVLPG
ncbi:MAG: NUDIX hydrolase [Actinomycetota bacterium]|nr:NUDIX hydrolase [Actinomycetota bacterium]